MPRPRKPTALHQQQGTYRKDRHGPREPTSAEVAAWNLQRLKCHMCGSRWHETDNPFATNAKETVYICAGCVLGAVIMFDSQGWDMVPDELIASYCETWNAEQQGKDDPV
jgi:hypothetical protein